MELFQLIAAFLQHLASWIPRPFLVNVTERAVRFRMGMEPRVVEPGLHLQVPLFSTVEYYSLLKDAYEFAPTVLVTKDLRVVSVGFVIVWHIKAEDVISAATTVDDLSRMIGEVGESLLPPLLLAHTFDELVDRVRGGRGLKPFNYFLTETADDLLTQYGVTVDYARINFLAPSRVFKLIGSER